MGALGTGFLAVRRLPLPSRVGDKSKKCRGAKGCTTTIQTHLWLLRGRASLFSGGFGGGGAGVGGAVAVVLGESLVLIVTGALGAVGALGVPGTFGLLPGPAHSAYSGDCQPICGSSFQNRIVNCSGPATEVPSNRFFVSPDINRDCICPNSFSCRASCAGDMRLTDTSPTKEAHYIPTIETVIWLHPTLGNR